jgi:hypothetical protein
MTRIADHCADTFDAALTWSAERRNMEIRGIVDFLNNSAAPLSSEDIQTLAREMRAVRRAGL